MTDRAPISKSSGRWPGTANDRFVAKVDVNGPIPAHRPELGPCHLWTGARTRGGYAIFANTTAGRFALQRVIGRPLTDDEEACHHCDNPPCVRGSHLFVGTPLVNHADMIAKGRSNRGERHGHARLTEDVVRQIRRLAATGLTHTAIATAVGVQRRNVSRIVDGTRWGHVVDYGPELVARRGRA